MSKSNQAALARRRLRVRNKLRKVANGRPRLTVFRASRNIYAQIIDDTAGRTLASASTLEKSGGLRGKSNADAAATVGKLIAERAKEAGVEEVLFDRSGYLFHGRVKALADAAREAGLKF